MIHGPREKCKTAAAITVTQTNCAGPVKASEEVCSIEPDYKEHFLSATCGVWEGGSGEESERDGVGRRERGRKSSPMFKGILNSEHSAQKHKASFSWLENCNLREGSVGDRWGDMEDGMASTGWVTWNETLPAHPRTVAWTRECAEEEQGGRAEVAWTVC